MMARHLARAPWVLACLALAACEFSAADYGPAPNTCARDEDCATGSACESTLHMCVAGSSAPLPISLEVIAPVDRASGASVNVLFPPTTVTGATPLDLTLPETVVVAGSLVARTRDGEVVPLHGELVFSVREPTTAAKVLRTSVDISTHGLTTFDGATANYAVRLLPETTYDVVVQPLGPSLASVAPMRLALTTPGAGAVRQDIEVEAAHTTLRGVVRRDAVSGVPGLLVWAVDATTGTVVSTTNTTQDGEAAGAFELGLASGVVDYRIKVTAPASVGAFPALTVDPRYLFPRADGSLEILVPALTPVTYRATVESQAGAAVPGATVRFRTEATTDDRTGIVGRYETTATADDRGSVTATLVAGTYDVVVVPPAGSGLAVAAETVSISESATPRELIGQVFTLRRMGIFAGRALAYDGEAVAYAQVQATALGHLLPRVGTNTAAHSNRSTSTTTDATGLFGLALDEGPFDIVVQPPAGTGLPWSVHAGIWFDDSAPATQNRFEIGAPIPVYGVVMQSDAQPVANAEVVAYQHVVDGEQDRAVVVARATTTSDGRYLLLLPAGVSVGR